MLDRRVRLSRRIISAWIVSLPISAVAASSITVAFSGPAQRPSSASPDEVSETSVPALTVSSDGRFYVSTTPTSTPAVVITPTATPSPTPPPSPTSSPTAVPVQLLNGQELLRVGPSGPSTLTVKNGTTQDALVKVVALGSGQTVRTVYVVRQSDWTIPAIAPGSYRLRFALGNDWDPVLQRFQRNTSFAQFEDPFDFEITGGQYTVWSVTLNPVIGGTAQTDRIGADSFYAD